MHRNTQLFKETEQNNVAFAESLEVGVGKYKFATEKGRVNAVEPKIKNAGTL